MCQKDGKTFTRKKVQQKVRPNIPLAPSKTFRIFTNYAIRFEGNWLKVPVSKHVVNPR